MMSMQENGLDVRFIPNSLTPQVYRRCSSGK